MLELEDITLREYIDLDDKSDYNFAIEYGADIYTKPEDTIGIGDIMSLPFGVIKDYQHEYQNGLSFNFQFETLQKLTDKKLGKMKLTEFYRGLCYFHKGIEELTEVESQTMSYSPTAKEVSSGIGEFAKYGVHTQIRKLAGGDVTKIEDVRATKYSDCFIELLYRHDDYVFQTKMNKV